MEKERQNIKVLVRVRPLCKKEQEAIDDYEAFWQGKKRAGNRSKLAQAALNFFTKYHNVRPCDVMRVVGSTVSVCDQEYKNSERKMKEYTFSDVFQEGISNKDIFDHMKEDIAGVFQGINCTLLAYGITGSGKTFSVFGHPKTDRGLSHLAFQYLFARKRELENEDVKVQMKFSFIEIYNENIRDLLSEDGRKQVTIGEDNKGNITLTDAMEVTVRSAEQIVGLISMGTAKRTSAATEYNLISSRSHAVLKMSMDVLRKGQRSTGKLFIIDLAGSEKINNQSNRRRNEGSNINRSLLTLGNCINALVENMKKPGFAHVPYRDSKLTRLLKDSLGGTARTIMIACISPHPFTLDETITTLNYAERAQGIKRDITRNVKQMQQECPRCRQLLAMNAFQKIDNRPFDGVNLNDIPQLVSSEMQSIFFEICQRLYEDIIENARQRQQIDRLKPEILYPCEQFDLILKDNEEQRVRLKQILFKLLNQKAKIVVKEPEPHEGRAVSERKKIRLSTSAKKQAKGSQVKHQFNEKQNAKKQFLTERKVVYGQIEEQLFPENLNASFSSPQQFTIEQEKLNSPAKLKENQSNQQFQSLQKPRKRRRSKFQMVPKPAFASASKASEGRVLAERSQQQAILE